LFRLTAIAGLMVNSLVWSHEPSYNVPLDDPVYQFIDMLPLPVTTDGVSLSSRPYTRQQVYTLLSYAKQSIKTSDTKLIDYYLQEFSETDNGEIKKYDLPLDGKNTRVYPYVVTSNGVQDSGFSKMGFDALGINTTSKSVEMYDKTTIGGRLYSEFNGMLCYFDGAIITEYGSKEEWVKTDDPSTGRNYTTIMTDPGKPGHLIGYDGVTAYVTLPVKHYDIMLGFDKLSWGYAGSSGLLFSGEGRPFLMAKASKTIGTIDYTFIVGKLTANTYAQNRIIYAKHITYTPVPCFAFGLSDAIVSVNDALKPAYFLPFVPYYFLDHYIGGTDNRIMSFDAQYNVRQQVSFYGELLIDEISNLLGVVTNKKANDVWGGIIGVKWYNPFPSAPASLLKAEFVQLEPWVYTRYTRAGEDLSNNPVNFGQPLGNQMGPHSRSFSLTYSEMLSEKINGSLGVTQYMKGIGPGSDILSGNNFVYDTVNGILTNEHQEYANKDYRFKNYSRNRTVVSASGTYNFKHWLQAELSGEFVHEREIADGNYFQVGVDVRVNY
jgi:hypothetical protein